MEIRWKNAHSACVILASGGYPLSYKTGFAISGLDEAENSGAVVYHAGTEYRQVGNVVSFYTAGGRVLGIAALAPELDTALVKAYKAAEFINFDGINYRKDIGKY